METSSSAIVDAILQDRISPWQPSPTSTDVPAVEVSNVPYRFARSVAALTSAFVLSARSVLDVSIPLASHLPSLPVRVRRVSMVDCVVPTPGPRRCYRHLGITSLDSTSGSLVGTLMPCQGRIPFAGARVCLVVTGRPLLHRGGNVFVTCELVVVR